MQEDNIRLSVSSLASLVLDGRYLMGFKENDLIQGKKRIAPLGGGINFLHEDVDAINAQLHQYYNARLEDKAEMRLIFEGNTSIEDLQRMLNDYGDSSGIYVNLDGIEAKITDCQLWKTVETPVNTIRRELYEEVVEQGGVDLDDGALQSKIEVCPPKGCYLVRPTTRMLSDGSMNPIISLTLYLVSAVHIQDQSVAQAMIDATKNPVEKYAHPILRLISEQEIRNGETSEGYNLLPHCSTVIIS